MLGKFRDLLGATAQSPAMLFYLDNWQSAAPDGADTADAAAQSRLRAPRSPVGPGATGLAAAGSRMPADAADDPQAPNQQQRRGASTRTTGAS